MVQTEKAVACGLLCIRLTGPEKTLNKLSTRNNVQTEDRKANFAAAAGTARAPSVTALACPCTPAAPIA